MIYSPSESRTTNGHSHGNNTGGDGIHNNKIKRSKIEIYNYPSDTRKDEIKHLCEKFGTILKCDLSQSKANPTDAKDSCSSMAVVTFAQKESALPAVNAIKGLEFKGNKLRACIQNGNISKYGGPFQNTSTYRKQGTNFNNQGAGNFNTRGRGYPLRLLVPSDYVGAIIGRNGATIREITMECKARVDVHGKENSGLQEKVISIYGQPDNCTRAALEILKVIQKESTSNSRGDILLKMLADDRYCGRIIGKEGKVIKKIRELTDTRITVSNSVQEVVALYPDRVITVKGSLNSMSAAEAALSQKLRECFDKELTNGYQNGGGGGGNNGAGGGGANSAPPAAGGGGTNASSSSTNGHLQHHHHPPVYAQMPMSPAMPNYSSFNAHRHFSNGHQYHYNGDNSMAHQAPTVDICQISIPNAAVGAIIGSGGCNIKHIIRESNAFVTIEAKSDSSNDGGDSEDNDGMITMPTPSNERIVTIKGVHESIWRANYFIFEKLKHEGFSGNEEVRLRTAITVPRTMVGRVIGKAGKNVRDLQRHTGAMIKLPEDQRLQREDVVVEIYGNFVSTQNAQARIRGLIANQASSCPPHVQTSSSSHAQTSSSSSQRRQPTSTATATTTTITTQRTNTRATVSANQPPTTTSTVSATSAPPTTTPGTHRRGSSNGGTGTTSSAPTNANAGNNSAAPGKNN